MKRLFFILLFLILALPFREGIGVGLLAAPPTDDAYYWPGESYKVKSTQMPIVETEWEEPVSEQPDSVCQPSIRFTSIQDTVVTAVIKRCE